jgi:chromate transporter
VFIIKEKDVHTEKTLKEVAKVFFKLGCIGFGGPAVHIAMMEEELVRKRQWLDQDHFLDLVGATNLIPGPNSTEMTMHCGHLRAGWKGLLVAGLCFILPAVLITGVIAWAYQKYGTLPKVTPFIYGIKPAIIAVIFALVISLGKKALKSFELWAIGTLCVILATCGVNEVLILFGAGALGVLLYLVKQKRQTLKTIVAFALLSNTTFTFNASSWKIAWLFLKIGAVLYGSGYVLFAFLDETLVKPGIISKQALVDAIAVGQFTPGPVFSSATFIGWQIGGISGAMAATAGIFLPSFFFVALLNPLVAKLRSSKIMAVFLDTVNVASIALILSICITMCKVSITDWRTICIAVAGFIIAFRFRKLNSAFIVLGGAVMGYILWLF